MLLEVWKILLRTHDESKKEREAREWKEGQVKVGVLEWMELGSEFIR